MSRVCKYFRILFLGECKLTHYFDVKGAQIFQNTLFRGVQTFIIILMCRVHKYFRILYLGGAQDVKGAQIFQNTLFRGVSKLTHYFGVKGAQIFQNTLFRRGVQPLCALLAGIGHTVKITMFALEKSKSRKVHMPGDFGSKSRKIRKNRKVEKSKS